MACEEFDEPLAKLHADSEALQNQLADAALGQKADIMRRIQEIELQIGGKEAEKDRCLIASGLRVETRIFMGMFEAGVHEGSSTADYSLALTFELFIGPHGRGMLISNVIIAPRTVGEDIITVAMEGVGAGTINKDTGYIGLLLNLRLHHSKHPVFGIVDSTLPLRLTTNPAHTGFAVDRNTGQVRLVARSRFVGGALDGNHVHVTCEGRLAPIP
jgi:hypothetical protein